MKIVLIQHTHTDIGYTERQDHIMRNHVDYIKQAIEISEQITSGKKQEWEGFRWTCEAFWAVELFFKKTDDSWHNRLIKAINHGHIEVSANYLNFNDLVDYEVLHKKINKAVEFGKQTNQPVKSAMAADVNGFTWGYVEAFHNNHVENFFTCVHTHHGMFPLFKKQTPFYWESPKGNKILVWNGDHYHTGNVLGFSPRVHGKFIGDEYVTFAKYDEKDIVTTKEKLDEYVEILQKQGYDYNFIPIMVSGIDVDNAAPNPHIVEYINDFNERYKNDYEVVMSTLNEFFDDIKCQNINIDTYRGDWPDWWSDGFMSTPRSTIIYRDAQNLIKQIRSLERNKIDIDETKLEEAEDYLALYAEHTWGYFSSISEPYYSKVAILDSVKQSYGIKAYELAQDILSDYKYNDNEAYLKPGRPLLFRAVNATDIKRKDVVKMVVGWWDFNIIEDGYYVVDVDTFEEIDHQEMILHGGARKEIWIIVDFKAHESKTFQIIPKTTRKKYFHDDPMLPADRVQDFKSIYHNLPVYVTQHVLETPFVRIEFKPQKGIVKWIDKKVNKCLIDNRCIHAPLTPIYQVTKHHIKEEFKQYEMTEKRNSFGRNRKGFNAKEYVGELINVKVLNQGNLLARVELLYELEGTKHCSITLTAYATQPRIDISFNLIKDVEWNPENIYLSFPFKVSDQDELWITKPGCTLRPRKDQLPGTLRTFYTVDTGFGYISSDYGIAISTKHAPIIHLGSLESKEISFFKYEKEDTRPALYSWVLNNYWETNFSANTSGLLSFDYNLYFSSELNTKAKLESKLQDISSELIQYRVKK